MGRIKLDTKVMDGLCKMSEGNPGAASVLAMIIKESKVVDPDSVDGMMTVLHLDDLEVYGPRIWMLYKDVCGQRIEKTLGILRAHQLGFLGKGKLIHAIDNMGEGIDLEELLTKVKKELPKFQLDLESIED